MGTLVNQFPGKALSSKTLAALILGLLPGRQSFQHSVLVGILATLVLLIFTISSASVMCVVHRARQNYEG